MLCTLTFLFLVVSSNQKDCYSWRKPTVAEKASLPEKDINRFCRTTTFFGFQTNIKGCLLENGEITKDFEVFNANSIVCDLWLNYQGPNVLPLPPYSIFFGKDIALAMFNGTNCCRLHYDGPNFGTCTYYKNGELKIQNGGIRIISARVKVEEKAEINQKNEISPYERLLRLVETYLLPEDENMISEIHGLSFHKIIEKLKHVPNQILEKSLTGERLVEHDEANSYGLACLRSILAERIIKFQRKPYENHPNFKQFTEKGYLMIKNYMDLSNMEKINLLSMVGAKQVLVTDLPKFISFPLPHIQVDNQRIFHLDSFAPVFKFWLLEEDWTKDVGPTEFIPGSHQTSLGKCRWLTEVSQTDEGKREPSFRFFGEVKDYNFAQPIQALAPKGTLLILQTNILHRRGEAKIGTIRRAARPSGAKNDGGLPRRNLYDDVSFGSSKKKTEL